MKSKRAKSLAAALWPIILLLATTSPAQTQNYAGWENGVTERWWVDTGTFTKPQLDRAIERWELIQKENESVKSHDWAGGYFTGSDIHGTYMRWSPRAGFVMAHVNKCAASLMGLTYGRVVASPTLVEFVVEYRNSSGSHGHAEPHAPAPTSIKFIPVKWSNDQYLVREDEMADFGDFVAGLGKYNQEFPWVEGMEFFARSISESESDYEELPQVPPGYQRFIKKPIDAEVRAVGVPRLKRIRSYDGSWQYEKRTPVLINVGSLRGVKKGMFFRVLSSDQGESIKIVRVSGRASEGILVRWLDENKQEYERYPKVRKGWRVSTSVHKSIPRGEG